MDFIFDASQSKKMPAVTMNPLCSLEFAIINYLINNHKFNQYFIVVFPAWFSEITTIIPIDNEQWSLRHCNFEHESVSLKGAEGKKNDKNQDCSKKEN